MSTAARRVKELETLWAQRERRKGRGPDIMEETRAFLEQIDGQHDLDMRPGENIASVMRRRLQNTDGYMLAGLPGDTLDEKEHSADLVARGLLSIPPEVRHAARFIVGLYEGI